MFLEIERAGIGFRDELIMLNSLAGWLSQGCVVRACETVPAVYHVCFCGGGGSTSC